jgi:hypothetical protein
LDATGEPLEEKNSPADAFEKLAVARLKAGEAYYDEVVDQGGQRYLRAATPIPVVLKKCAMCHPHYENVAQGKPIGALAYKLPIE